MRMADGGHGRDIFLIFFILSFYKTYPSLSFLLSIYKTVNIIDPTLPSMNDYYYALHPLKKPKRVLLIT